MQNQVGAFLLAHLTGASSNALYTFWGGSNDVLTGANPITAADNIASEIQSVAADGGHDFLWLNLPGLGHIPDLSGTPAGQAAANLSSEAFDAEWLADLNHLDALGINVIGVDVNSLFNQILADPGAFRFSNVTSACNMTVGCDPNTFLYWDGEHPTTYADSLVATLAYDDAFGPASSTPEPPTILLVGAAAIGLLMLRRRAALHP
jgi:phospholipase/lecithinase/hemolysin